jgi:hypothetical protein
VLIPSCIADTTFCRINRPYLSRWEYYNKDKHDHGLVYQVVCSLGKPFRILSFDGPFKGSAADVSIIRKTIIPKLLPEERILCDKSYWRETKCWCPPLGEIKGMTNEQKEERRNVTNLRQLVERVIGRLKTWGCLKKRWKFSWELHELCAKVVAKLTQLELYVFPLT